MALGSDGGEEAGLQSILVSRTRDHSADVADAGGAPNLAPLPAADTLALYLREIAREPLLSAEEEVVLARAMEAGQAAEKCLANGSFTIDERSQLEEAQQTGREARARLIRANTRLVVSIAKKYRGLGLPFLDLIQEGNLGLLQAVARFDYRLGHRFSTYATWWIRQGVTRAIANKNRLIRLPAHLAQAFRKLSRATHELTQELTRGPTPEELAIHLSMPCERVRLLLAIRRQTLSLDLLVGDDVDAELIDFVEDAGAPDPEEVVARVELAGELEQVLEQLTPRQARILRLRYGLRDGKTHTLKQIADMFGLSRERIRQLQEKALATILNSDTSLRLRHYRRG